MTIGRLSTPPLCTPLTEAYVGESGSRSSPAKNLERSATAAETVAIVETSSMKAVDLIATALRLRECLVVGRRPVNRRNGRVVQPQVDRQLATMVRQVVQR